MKKSDLILLTVFFINTFGCLFMDYWVASLGWACAFLTQLRIMDVIKID